MFKLLLQLLVIPFFILEVSGQLKLESVFPLGDEEWHVKKWSEDISSLHNYAGVFTPSFEEVVGNALLRAHLIAHLSEDGEYKFTFLMIAVPDVLKPADIKKYEGMKYDGVSKKIVSDENFLIPVKFKKKNEGKWFYGFIFDSILYQRAVLTFEK